MGMPCMLREIQSGRNARIRVRIRFLCCRYSFVLLLRQSDGVLNGTAGSELFTECSYIVP